MDSSDSDHITPFLLPSSSSSQVLQSLAHEHSMVDLSGTHRRRRSVLDDELEADDDDFGSLYRQPEKKRRLTPTQVQYLERSFDLENKLEPERKNQLAKDLGLQPRQVAIWFQNRRARYKTKQLEKDYDALKSRFDSLQADFDLLLKDKDQLQTQVSMLTAQLKKNDTNSPIHTELQPAATPVKELAGATTELLPCKQEDASSAKSDVFDSESPHCPETTHSNSISISQAYELEPSDLSPDEVGDLTGGFMPMVDYGFGKAEDGDFNGGSCSSLGLPGLEGQPAYWPWLY